MAHLVLSQHAQRPHGDLKYLDVEGSLYHYPRAYFPFVNGYEAFVYYRPQRGAPADERTDSARADHRYVRIADYKPFARPVPFARTDGPFYESTYTTRNAFQGRAVRPISELDFTHIQPRQVYAAIRSARLETSIVRSRRSTR